MRLISPVLLGLTCILFIAMSIPLLSDKVTMNQSYGIRTAESMSSPENWSKANVFGGWAMLISSTISLVLLSLIARFGKDLIFNTVVSFLAFLFPVLISVMVTLVFASQLGSSG